MRADPPPLTRIESDEVARRRRGRNWAMFVALLLLCAIFYAMAWVKMTKS